MNFLAVNLAYFIGIADDFSVADEYTGRIIKFRKIGISIMEDLQNRECSIGHFSHLADRKRLSDRLHTGFNLCALLKHRAKDLGRQCCQYISLYTASHAVGKNQDIRILCLQDFHLVPAQFLLILIQALPRHVNAHTCHILPPLFHVRLSAPSAISDVSLRHYSSSFRIESRSLVRVTFVSAVVSPRSPAIS